MAMLGNDGGNAAGVLHRSVPMNVTQAIGPGASVSLRSPMFVTVPEAAAYRIANARVPIDLAPAVADHAAADRFADCDIVVDGARIAMLGRPARYRGPPTCR